MTALMLSGGGAKGSFAVGALQYMGEQGLQFDMCSGTSTGSIVGACLLGGKEKEMRNYYSGSSTSDMLTANSLNDLLTGKAEALFGTGPLQARLEQIIDQAAADKVLNGPVPFFITAVSLQVGDLVYFHNVKQGPFPVPGRAFLLGTRTQLIDAILASSAVPLSLPPRYVIAHPPAQGAPPPAEWPDQYVDGGVKEYSPLRILIANGAVDIIAIVLRPAQGRRINMPYGSALKAGFRVIDLLSDEVGETDLEGTFRTNLAIAFNEKARHDASLSGAATAPAGPLSSKSLVNVTVIRPAEDLMPGDSLNFRPTQMQAMIEHGYECAKAALTAPG